MPKRKATVEEIIARFWSYVDKTQGEDACWIWKASKNEKGYGVCWNGSRTRLAHRFAFEITFGPLPKGPGYHGVCALHRCDNPSCVNPKHLFLGTNHDNVRDMREKKRHKNPPRKLGESHHSSKLTESKVIEIRRKFAAGCTYRELGEEYNVTWQQILHVVTRRHWAHVA